MGSGIGVSGSSLDKAYGSDFETSRGLGLVAFF